MMRNLLLLLLLVITTTACEGDYTIVSQDPGETVYIEVEVPSDPEYIYGDVWVDSFEQPYSVNGVDIVWLIDKSCSMVDDAPAIVSGIEQMMNSLPPAGWRLGITSTSNIDSASASEFPLVPGDDIQDAWDAYGASGNNAREGGFDSIYAYIEENEYNQTWLRNDAALLIVFVSDEEEQSQEYFTFDPAGLSDFINWASAVRQSVYVASIVNVHETENECGYAVNTIDVGHRYIDATNAFNGVVVDICAEDWAPGVTEASTQIEPYDEWPLTYIPVQATVRVFEDGQLMDPAKWVYNIIFNKVEFLITPNEGSLIEIGYVIDPSEAGDDDDSAE